MNIAANTIAQSETRLPAKSTPDHEQPTFIEIGPEDRVEETTSFGHHGRRSGKTIIIYKGQDKQPPTCVTNGHIQKGRVVPGLRNLLCEPSEHSGGLTGRKVVN